MAANELIHDASFRLEEAMAAVELFDAKMDAGIGASNQNTVARMIELSSSATAAAAATTTTTTTTATATTASLSLPDPASLSLAAQCDLFDSLLAREIEFYAGETLAETMLTCLYVHVVDSLPLQLRAIVHSALLCCAIARDHVSLARIAVEEDFVPSTQGFTLPPTPASPLDVAALTATLDSALAQLDESADATRLRLRLQMRRAALIALARLNAATLGGRAIAASLSAIEDLLPLCEALRVEVVAADAPVPAARGDLHSYTGRGSSKLVVPDSIAGVFDRQRARHLLRPFPPRHVRRRLRIEAVLQFATQFEQLRTVMESVLRDASSEVTPELAASLHVVVAPLVDVADEPASDGDAATSPQAPLPAAAAREHANRPAENWLLRLVESACATSQLMERQRANVVVRSFLARFVLPLGTFGGLGDGRAFVLASIRNLWTQFDPELAARADALLSKMCDLVPQVTDVVDLLGKVERNWLCFRCAESGHQRRKLAHVILDFGELQRRIKGLTDVLAPLNMPQAQQDVIVEPLLRWVNERACIAVVEHTELSIAHGLFEPWELPQAYWLLEHFFASQLVNYREMLGFVGRYRFAALRETQAVALDRQAAALAEKVKKGKNRIEFLKQQKEAEEKASRLRSTPLTLADYSSLIPPVALMNMDLAEAKGKLARGTLQLLLAANVDAVRAMAAPAEPLPVDPDETDPKKLADAAVAHISRPRVALQVPPIDVALTYARRFTVAHGLEYPVPIAFHSFQQQVNALATSDPRNLVTQAADSLKRARAAFEASNKALPATAARVASLTANANQVLQAQRDELRVLAMTALTTALNVLKWPKIEAPRTAVLHITWPHHRSYCVVAVTLPEKSSSSSPSH
jgi:hypothetical protein